MRNRALEKTALKVHNVRQWLARKSIKQRKIRGELGRKPELTWWLVYGPPRTGTSYLVRLIKSCSRLYVNDWGLAAILAPIPGWLELKSDPARDFITFDHDRFLRDISSNILDNAYKGDGEQLDLVYKQVALCSNEYQALVKMWGPPVRAIFCLREPAGYMASAAKKFPHGSRDALQQMYINAIHSYLQIKGDAFEYTPELSVSDYVSFLEPLNLKGKRLPPFQYRGEQDHDSTSEEMWSAYRGIKESLFNHPCQDHQG